MNSYDADRIRNAFQVASGPVARTIDRRSLLKTGGALGLTGLVMAMLPGGRQFASAHSNHQDAAASPVPGPQADGTNLWKVVVGGMDMENKLDFQGFFPGEIVINAGDQIWFQSAMPGLHNAWFGYGAEPPALFIPDPELASPAAGEMPSLVLNPDMILPTPNQVVDGVTPVNTGVDILWDPAIPVIVTFSTPGTYEYLCIPHQAVMRGTIIVQEAGAALPLDQAGVDALAAEQLAALAEEGMAATAEFAEPVAEAQADGATLWTAALGAGNGQARVMAILPSVLEIKVGDSVKWINQSAGEPHNVTFLGEGETPPEEFEVTAFADGRPKFTQNMATFLPSGTTVWEGTGYLQSGFMGIPELGLPMEFTASFPVAGEFIYYCSLHGDAEGGGMAATLRVVE
ncbi:MAG: plastocyanin/azurin family copper-binding protein [Thermomicrobiales bacterium]